MPGQVSSAVDERLQRLSVPDGFQDLVAKFTREVLRSQPDDIVAFAAEYFQTLKGGGNFDYSGSTNPNARAPITGSSGDTSNSNASSGAPVNGGNSGAPPARNGNANGDDGEHNNMDNDTVGDIPDFPPQAFSGRRRVSVSAESMDPSKMEVGERIVHPKTQEQKEAVLASIKESFLFSGLDDDQVEEVVDAMFEKTCSTGEVVIQYGDDGDYFYIIQTGVYEILIPDGEGGFKKVGSYNQKGSFGELALMYNQPRAATINCTEDGILWALDRVTFRRILMTSTFKKRRMYEDFLEKIPLLDGLDSFERSKVADALVTKTYQDGDTIISEGEEGDAFFFVEDGTVTVKVNAKDGSSDMKEVKKLQTGEYFGELALIDKKPRAASIFAEGTVKCAALNVDAFERLLGPCVEIMGRNKDKYAEELKAVHGE
eukprot:Clim_evm77s157 gene=Clim_evmTU77s157